MGWPRRQIVDIINRVLPARAMASAPNRTPKAGGKHISRQDWPHISRQDVYNIEMALLRNHGYGARRVDVGRNRDPMIQVVDDTDRIVMTVKVSTDGLNWVIGGDRDVPVVMPLATECADLADTIVAELRKPH
jgi:hypothetical protein